MPIVAGTVTDGGTAVSGATVDIVDSSTNTTVASVTTAADGSFSYDAAGTGPFHAAARTDDGKRHALSYHSIQ